MWVLILFAGLLLLALGMASLGTFDAVAHTAAGLCLCTAATISLRRARR